MDLPIEEVIRVSKSEHGYCLPYAVYRSLQRIGIDNTNLYPTLNRLEDELYHLLNPRKSQFFKMYDQPANPVSLARGILIEYLAFVQQEVPKHFPYLAPFEWYVLIRNEHDFTFGHMAEIFAKEKSIIVLQNGHAATVRRIEYNQDTNTGLVSVWGWPQNEIVYDVRPGQNTFWDSLGHFTGHGSVSSWIATYAGFIARKE